VTKEREQREARLWYDPDYQKKLYRHGNPRPGFYEKHGGDRVIDPLVKSFHDRHPDSTGLQVGPGNVHALKPFHDERMTFVDSSSAVLKRLPGRKIHMDVRKVRLPQYEHGIVVVSDVLTHVEPRDRPAVVKKLAGWAAHELIIAEKLHENTMGKEGQSVDIKRLKRALGNEFEVHVTFHDVPLMKAEETYQYFVLHGKRKGEPKKPRQKKLV
jgi:hypothetical protein